MDQMPYLLTANHCFSTQTEAQSLRVYWNYNSEPLPTCPANCTDGANLLVTGTTSDFTFVRLTGTVPGGLFFSGWDAATFSTTASIAGIHHPDATHKRISFGNARQPTPGECGPGLQCLAVDWTSGVTEPGSSGSGIWKGLPTDPGGAKLIGTLTGGPSACPPAGTDLRDFYGRFSVTYPTISSFLEGTNCVTSLNPTSQNFSSSGGTGNSFTVNAPGGCNWTAVSSDAFVTITSGSNGTGNGTVTYNVASNGGAQRFATIVVGGQVFNITQSGGGACAPTPISIGQTVNGTLSNGDCANPLDGSFLDAYSFNATAGQQVSVLMTSSALDSYLYLYRPDGSKLAEDDDGGGLPNSRIPPGSGFITLPITGTYTIWANSFAAGETGPYTLTLSTKPVIFAEEGINNAAALDSVTFLRGPFRVFDPNNFSADQHTRIILFTSDLGLTQSDLSNPATLVVDVPGFNLPVEAVGGLTGVPGLSGSYIVVRLPDGLPTGALDLRVRLRGVTSDARTLNISP
jgi:hypothetical protein